MSSHPTDEAKRHRHDEGAVCHGSSSQETVTRAVQYTLALCVIGSALLVVFALTVSASSHY